MRQILLLLLPVLFFAQNGVGFRFATDILFFNSNNQPLISGAFSVANFGPKVKLYNDYGGIELGVNMLYKEHRGGFNFPGIMADFKQDNSTAWTSYELDFRFGPRIKKYFYPKTGYRLGYLAKAEGFLQDDSRTINKIYFILPVGFSIELPTQFGSTGFGFMWNIFLTNFLKRPQSFFGDYNGGRLQGLNVVINVMIGD